MTKANPALHALCETITGSSMSEPVSFTEAPGYASFIQLDAGYVLTAVSDGSQSAFELYHDAGGDGAFTLIAQVSEAAVELVGIQASSTAIDGLT